MIIWPPYGSPSGTEWSNGNPATGARGSIADCRAIDHAQKEIVNAIARLGLTPDVADLEQLGKAIQNAIAAATGGGDTSGYVTMETARARLPVYPEVLNATGKITVTEPSSGTIFIPSVDTIRHRGIYDVAMSDIADVDRTFSMLPSKVAHLRWSAASGLQRFYLDDAGYNPGGLPETDASFDSSYDSALLARVVTNASAVSTITSLANKDRLTSVQSCQWQNIRAANPTEPVSRVGDFSVDFNWARTPQIVSFDCARHYSVATTTAGDSDWYILAYGDEWNDTKLDTWPYDRYGSKFSMLQDNYDNGLDVVFQISAGA